MAKNEVWPKKNKADGAKPKKVCCICRKDIQDGESYHYLRRKRLLYFHEDCYKEELGSNG